MSSIWSALSLSDEAISLLADDDVSAFSNEIESADTGSVGGGDVEVISRMLVVAISSVVDGASSLF